MALFAYFASQGHSLGSYSERPSRVSPLERLGKHFVEIREECQQLAPQIFHRSKVTTPDHLAHHHSKDNFNLIQPRRVLGQVDKADTMAQFRQEILPTLLGFQYPTHTFLSQIVFDPTQLGYQLHQASGLMNVQIVQHNHVACLRINPDGLLDVPHKVCFRAGWPQRGSDHLPRDHMQIANEGEGALSLILEFLEFLLPRVHRQGGGHPRQRLDARHLIDAQSVRVVVMKQLRSVLVASTHRLHLGLKQRGVFFGGVQPIATAMGLQLRFPQIASDLSRGNGSNDAAPNDFLGEFINGPVRDGSAGLLGGFASDGQDKRDLFGSELAWASGARLIPKEFLDGLTQGSGCLQTFDADQLGEGRLPAATPEADLVTFQSDLTGDVSIVQSSESQQEDGGALNQTLGHSTGPAQGLEDRLLSLADHDLGCRSWHGSLRCVSGCKARQSAEYSKNARVVVGPFGFPGLVPACYVALLP